LAALPLIDPNTLPEPKTLPSVTSGHELVGSSEDWQTVATTGTGLTKSFENAMQIQAGDAVCAFEKHHSAVAGRKGSVRVQERPFSRVSWVSLRASVPLCERCTSTLRKHWAGQTTSMALCQEFLAYVARVQCRGCTEWVAGEMCQRTGDMVCDKCAAAGGTVVSAAARREGPAPSAAAPAAVAPIYTDYTPELSPTQVPLWHAGYTGVG